MAKKFQQTIESDCAMRRAMANRSASDGGQQDHLHAVGCRRGGRHYGAVDRPAVEAKGLYRVWTAIVLVLLERWIGQMTITSSNQASAARNG